MDARNAERKAQLSMRLTDSARFRTPGAVGGVPQVAARLTRVVDLGGVPAELLCRLRTVGIGQPDRLGCAHGGSPPCVRRGSPCGSA